ncbi:NUDIX hydrolase [Streptomyces viridochromogenes]|uniref:NUDIX hydrolase n=1 Tax=Streptomyces viridochromogenes TaxID=1938 RepID=A0A0J7ZKU5_STRVR|nr:phosphotransferase [Streptomyces viridochromogenes]KMS75768.1 NUDIX hydrolase [Streptomyces viridochromogenes]
MSGQATGRRYMVPVDVHLILLRDGPKGRQVLLSRRAGDVYAAGMWHLPSGHLDGPHEDVVEGGIREQAEETGLLSDRSDIRAAVTVHHRAPSGSARVGIFLVVLDWQGEPRILEEDRCDGMDWFRWDGLPEPMVAYCRAGLDAYRAGARLAVHFQQPGDPVAHDPARDRLRIVPDGPETVGVTPPDDAVRAFAERAVGRIGSWTDTSSAGETSRVWRVARASGGTWYVKQHQNATFHHREVHACRHWVAALGPHAPRLVAADPVHRTVVLTRLPGRPLHGQALPVGMECEVHRQVGELTARYHQAADAIPAPPPGPGSLLRHLEVARPLLAPGEEDLVLHLAELRGTLPPTEHVPILGDLQPRNILVDTTVTADTTGSTDIPASPVWAGLIDFERSELGLAVRDFVRLLDTWVGRPDLCEAFFTGYGRALTDDERQRLRCEAALDAVSGIAYGHSRHDPELVERGRRTLRALRTDTLI